MNRSNFVHDYHILKRSQAPSDKFSPAIQVVAVVKTSESITPPGTMEAAQFVNIVSLLNSLLIQEFMPRS